ncbi:MAG: eukaryotic-like serine/threonine-protein kinase [Actinomycetota bacterium]|jgi:RNA polymerase sigma-70 factor (ECF subfamily)
MPIATLHPIEGRSDEELAQDARRGDQQALEALLRRHHDRLHALCWRMTGNRADAADATQEALIAITRGLPRYDARARFGTWAYRVAVNACIDELRKRRRRPEPMEAAQLGEKGLLDRSDREQRGPDAGVVDRIVIDDALRALNPEFRAAVVLRDLCGLEYAEIAEVLDVPIGTVRSRLARGRGALADRLGGNQRPTGDRPRPDDA